MFESKKMSEEQIKEAMEIVQKLDTQLDGAESYLEQLAAIGCDNYKVDLVLTISDAVNHLTAIKENIEFYKRPIAWR